MRISRVTKILCERIHRAVSLPGPDRKMGLWSVRAFRCSFATRTHGQQRGGCPEKDGLFVVRLPLAALLLTSLTTSKKL